MSNHEPNPRWRRWGIACGALAAALTGISLGMVDLQTPLRSTLQQPLYELGMDELVGPLNATIVNGAGHILSGVLLMIAAIARQRLSGRSHLVTMGALLLAGIFWAAQGVVPARYGDEEAMVVHGIWMLGFQLTAGVALLLLAWEERVIEMSRSLLLGLGAILVLASPLAGLRGLPVPGLLERIGIGAFFACIGLLSYGQWRAVARMDSHNLS